MEFHEKLQELRKQKGLTQEELAQALYVSRTAVSKWESGRGYPNIDSLKAMAEFFSVTVDELLSGEEVLSIAEESSREKEVRFRNLVFGTLDCSGLLLLILPLFGMQTGEGIAAVSLLSMAGYTTYLLFLYWGIVVGMAALGIVTFALQKRRSFRLLSLLLNAVGVLLFIVSLQPYAAVFLFLFLAIKVLLLIKRR
ncbi:MAG: helix-turn-helix transcriptional regulator [Oscillospiraceae bacterium]|nr:helix-turn-helix transcriptional regulator [Oscillospiraceae bacterium]